MSSALWSWRNPTDNTLSKTVILQTSKEIKRIRKTEYVTLNECQQLLLGKSVEFLTEQNQRPKPFYSVVNTHNVIDRRSLTTGDSGNLFELEEYYLDSKNYPYLSIYFHVYDESWVDKIKTLFEELSLAGYGKKKSIGKGNFKVIDIWLSLRF